MHEKQSCSLCQLAHGTGVVRGIEVVRLLVWCMVWRRRGRADISSPEDTQGILIGEYMKFTFSLAVLISRPNELLQLSDARRKEVRQS